MVAAQSRLTKKSAAEILDIVFTNIGKAVKKDTRFSYPGLRHLVAALAQGAEDPQPADQRDDEAQGVEDGRLPARQGAEELAVVRAAGPSPQGREPVVGWRPGT